MNGPRVLRRSLVLVAGMLLPAGLFACGDLLQEPDTGIATLVDITAVSGDDQSGCPGLALEGPLRARLVSQSGGSVERLWVEWIVVDGGGRVEPRNGFTDEDGIVEAIWVLGPRASRQQVVARFAGETETFEAGFSDFCPLG